MGRFEASPAAMPLQTLFAHRKRLALVLRTATNSAGAATRGGSKPTAPYDGYECLVWLGDGVVCDRDFLESAVPVGAAWDQETAQWTKAEPVPSAIRV